MDVDFQAEPIAVEGLLLAGDGSGGEHSKDPRIRRCGFGVAILEDSKDGAVVVVKLIFGTVPGGQDSYRAEATAILCVLLRIVGNCVMIVDSEAVYKTFKKPPNSNLKHNGLLWQAIFEARADRLSRGVGSINLKWVPSHKTIQQFVGAGGNPLHWAANSIADSLAGQAALESALDPDSVAESRLQHKVAHRVLRRLVCVARFISPVTSAHVRTPNTYSDQGRGGKAERLVALARSSGHSLTSALTCVKCGFQVNVSHNCAY